MVENIFKMVENTGKWSKSWLSAVSPFPTILFSKAFNLKVVKINNCLHKCQII